MWSARQPLSKNQYCLIHNVIHVSYSRVYALYRNRPFLSNSLSTKRFVANACQWGESDTIGEVSYVYTEETAHMRGRIFEAVRNLRCQACLCYNVANYVLIAKVSNVIRYELKREKTVQNSGKNVFRFYFIFWGADWIIC